MISCNLLTKNSYRNKLEINKRTSQTARPKVSNYISNKLEEAVKDKCGERRLLAAIIYQAYNDLLDVYARQITLESLQKFTITPQDFFFNDTHPVTGHPIEFRFTHLASLINLDHMVLEIKRALMQYKFVPVIETNYKRPRKKKERF